MKRKTTKNEFSIRLALFTIAIIILLPTLAQAVNLGSVLKNNYAEARRGETVSFTVLFWNTDETSLPIKLSVKDAPKGWIVIINPKEFTLSQSKPESPPYEEGVEYMNIQNSIIKTKPVEILVKVSQSAKQGKYDVIINANAGKSNQGISVVTERNLKLTVNILTGLKADETTSPIPTVINENITKRIADTISGMASAVTEQDHALFLIVASIIVVIGVFWIVNKYL